VLALQTKNHIKFYFQEELIMKKVQVPLKV